MKIHANSISMHYDLTGEGKCVVFVHGFGDNLQMKEHDANEELIFSIDESEKTRVHC